MKQKNSTVALASIAAFGLYFCAYAFRKPFTSASYSGLSLWGLDYKTILVIAQVAGYTLSKFVGIKVIPTVQRKARSSYILSCIALAEISLLLFGTVSHPYNFIFLFLNGVSLGLIMGLVFSYLEGRKTTEILAVSQSISMIISTAVVKATGKLLLDDFHVSEFWMPFLTGLIYLLPLIGFVWLIDRTPAPSLEDEEDRVERITMNKRERNQYFRLLAPGLVLLVASAILLTIFRDLRDSYSIEILTAIGYGSKAGYLAYSEIAIGIIVLGIMVTVMYVRNHQKAVNILHLMMASGMILILLTTTLFVAGMFNPYLWFTTVGIGLFLAYVPFHGILFDRLVALFGRKGNASFLIYIVDAYGYLGSVVVLLYKSFYARQVKWLQFFVTTSYVASGLSLLCIIFAMLYFIHRKKYLSNKNHETPIEEQEHLAEKEMIMETQIITT